MKISIVIPAYNEAKLLPATLQSVKRSAQSITDRGWDVEVVVCDNNSTDDTAALARAAGAQVVFEPVNQIGRARNCGARTATGDWLVFIDADSHPSPDLLSEVCDAIDRGECLAGGCTVRLDQRTFLGDLFTALWNCISRVRRWAAGSFIFCQASAFREVGGFSDKLFASEELDLFIRFHRLARQRQRRIVILHRHPLITSARKFHLYRASEYFRFMLGTALTGGRSLRQASSCPIWYDGRR